MKARPAGSRGGLDERAGAFPARPGPARPGLSPGPLARQGPPEAPPGRRDPIRRGHTGGRHEVPGGAIGASFRHDAVAQTASPRLSTAVAKEGFNLGLFLGIPIMSLRNNAILVEL